MTGLQTGERVLMIGGANGGRLGSIAARLGLSGRAVAVVFDEGAASRVKKGAEHAGALIEIQQANAGTVPVEEDAFDLAFIDDTAGLLSSLRAEDRVSLVRETWRALRPGGRVMVLGAGGRGGLGALLSRAQSGEPFDPLPFLEADGFKAGRRLAEREGLVFYEAVKPRH
jgi:SAM-dependent methyltransferase